jgi:PAS domain S-box-containing protein
MIHRWVAASLTIEKLHTMRCSPSRLDLSVLAALSAEVLSAALLLQVPFRILSTAGNLPAHTVISRSKETVSPSQLGPGADSAVYQNLRVGNDHFIALTNQFNNGPEISPVGEPTLWARYETQIISVIGLVILQTLLITALLYQRRKRLRATRKLAESEERNRAILLALPDLMFLQTAEGVCLDYHVRDLQTSLIRPEAFLGRNIFDVLQPRLASVLREKFEQALNTGQTQVLEYATTIDGRNHWFEARIAPCSGRRLLSLVRDINERKKTEEALVESEAFNRRIVESSSDCVKILDLDGNLVFMSKRGQELLEVDDIEPLINQSWIKFWRGSEQAKAKVAVEAARKGGIGSFQGFGQTFKGRPRWWHTMITPILDVQGNVERLLAVSRDLTDQELANRARLESEKRFAKTFQSNPQPMSLTTLTDGRYLDVNDSFLTMSGYAREQIIGRTSKELGVYEITESQPFPVINPDAKNSLRRNVETKFKPRNGKLRVLLSSAELLELGGEHCILIASTDISERKVLEEELRRSELQFSTLVENSPDIICRLDAQLRYTYVSPSLEKTTGVPTNQLLNKTPREITWSDHDLESFEASCREAIGTQKCVNRAFEYDGRHYWTRIIPEFDADENVKSILVISQDVTDRIRSEQELVQLSLRLLNLQDEERRRIARELHDGTSQNLFVISVNLAKLNQHPTSIADIRPLISECQSLVDQSVQEIRTLSYLLHPPLLDHAGLVSALQWYVEGFTKRSGIYVDVFAQPIGRLSSDIEMALFRIVQEALTNVRRHSGSETATIRLGQRQNEIVLEIKDQGQGLRGPGDDPDEPVSMGVGIPGMKQRLRQLGGRLEIVSHKHGTTVSAVVPLVNGVNHGTDTTC